MGSVMMKNLVLSIGVAIALTCAAPAAFAQKQKNSAEQAFLKEAMQGSLAEIEMGKLAQQKGNSAEVRSLGKTFEEDHTKALQKAQEAAKSLGMNMPAEPAKRHKSAYEKLSKQSGPAFDRQFAKHMIEDHKKDIKEHEKPRRIPTQAVASYANDVLPDLGKHLEMAQSLSRSTTTGSR